MYIAQTLLEVIAQQTALNPTVYIALTQTPLLSHTCHKTPHPLLTPPKLVAREWEKKGREDQEEKDEDEEE